MNNMSKIICFFLVILVFSTTISCNKKDVLSEDKMVAVLKDLYLAESMYDVNHGSFRTENARHSLYDAVLKKHGITEAQLDSSLVWYSDNAQIYIRVSDSIVSSFKQELTDLDVQYAQLNNSRYSQLKLVPSSFYLSQKNPLLRFNLDSLQVKKYPNFNLKFETLGVKPSDSLLFSLAYVYKDTTIFKKQLLLSDQSYQFKNTSTLPVQDLESMYGFIYANPSKIGLRNILLHHMSIKNDSLSN